MTQIELYQSVLRKLSKIQADQLQEVDDFLSSLTPKAGNKERNRADVLELAGSWADMDESAFKDYLQRARDTGHDLFNRQVEL